MNNTKKLFDLLTKSKNQSKIWRKQQKWYKNGKSNECEIYQRKQLSTILNLDDIPKTKLRLHISTNKILEENRPLANCIDGFEYTEDFDGIINNENSKLLFNLKMICDQGGAQTRTIREVYHFIECQFKYLINNENENTYFINILDGDNSYKYTYGNKNKKTGATIFHLYDKYKDYSQIKDKIYIGDLYHFQKWYQDKVVNK